MHDESPGGQACKERTLAYWSDPKRFRPDRIVSTNKQTRRSRFARRWNALVWHYIDSVDIFLNGR